MGNRVLDWVMDNVMPWLMSFMFLLMAAALLIGLPLLVWSEATSATFSLRKDAWVCTASHAETSTSYVTSGSVLVPITSSTTVCDGYARVPH